MDNDAQPDNSEEGLNSDAVEVESQSALQPYSVLRALYTAVRAPAVESSHRELVEAMPDEIRMLQRIARAVTEEMEYLERLAAG